MFFRYISTLTYYTASHSRRPYLKIFRRDWLISHNCGICMPAAVRRECEVSYLETSHVAYVGHFTIEGQDLCLQSAV